MPPDTKLDLPATTMRGDLMKAMDGHVIGKAAYVGRFHGQLGSAMQSRNTVRYDVTVTL
jgi:hypothetical protein